MQNEPLSNEKTFVCFSCMEPNQIDNRFCKSCNAPISQFSSNDPLQIAYGEGLAYRKSVEAKPKFVILLGVWVLFFPTLIGCILTMVMSISEGGGSTGFVIFWMSVALGGFSCVMLYRITKNYFYFEEKKDDELANIEDFD